MSTQNIVEVTRSLIEQYDAMKLRAEKAEAELVAAQQKIEELEHEADIFDIILKFILCTIAGFKMSDAYACACDHKKSWIRERFEGMEKLSAVLGVGINMEKFAKSLPHIGEKMEEDGLTREQALEYYEMVRSPFCITQDHFLANFIRALFEKMAASPKLNKEVYRRTVSKKQELGYNGEPGGYPCYSRLPLPNATIPPPEAVGR